MSRSRAKSYRLSELVERFGGELIGAGSIRVSAIAPLASAEPHQIAFFTSQKLRRQLDSTRAGAVIVGAGEREATQRPRIVCDNPYAYFARIAALLNPERVARPGRHPKAVVERSARVAATASVGALAYVGPRAVVGARAVVGPGCVIGEEAVIGEATRLHANVVVYPGCRIGARCILHAGAVIGADGFGMAMDEGRWVKVPQVGAVAVGDDVEIGANTTIDRGALDDTVIEDGVKLDNQIQVGHNVRIGAHTAIAGCTGIAGSANIGRYCKIGGSAMILGHLAIADHVDISAGTFVSRSITQPGQYTSSIPCQAHRTWLRNAAQIRRLDELAGRLAAVESRIADAKGKK